MSTALSLLLRPLAAALTIAGKAADKKHVAQGLAAMSLLTLLFGIIAPWAFLYPRNAARTGDLIGTTVYVSLIKLGWLAYSIFQSYLRAKSRHSSHPASTRVLLWDVHLLSCLSLARSLRLLLSSLPHTLLAAGPLQCVRSGRGRSTASGAAI
ncbi:hypothetical protein C8R47DRAFT_262520 [Mycena vitilis]|nr:hypothetical protein C8R47DRAFT_262520 [Mycena vitilis]